jgi:hypothetical protein
MCVDAKAAGAQQMTAEAFEQDKLAKHTTATP